MNNAVSKQSPRTYAAAFSVVTAVFFMWGFITVLNDILIPHLKGLFSLTYAEAASIQLCWHAAYLLLSIPAGKFVSKLGYKNGMMTGLFIASSGCLLFLLAAGSLSFMVFLCGFFILASGITLLQVAANPYVLMLGPRETASSRLNFAQAINSLGTTLAPLFGSWLILSGVQTSRASAQNIRVPYISIALALAAIATILALLHLPKIKSTEVADSKGSGKSVWRYPHLAKGALGIFLYVGAEVSIGSFLVNYLGLSEVMAFKPATAGRFVAYYWAGAMVGRFFGSYALRKVRPPRALAFNAFAATALVMITILSSGSLAMWSVLSVGLFNSIMFPTIFALAVDGLGENTGQASGILCMAIVGAGVVPFLQGQFADHWGLHHSFVVPVLCYLYVAYYGLAGYKPKPTQALSQAAPNTPALSPSFGRINNE